MRKADVITISLVIIFGGLILTGLAHVPTGVYRGGISFKDNTDTVNLNSAAKSQITDFDTVDNAFMMTPSHITDDITVGVTCDYLCLMFVSVMNNASQQHTLDISVWKNNGATELRNVHSDRDVSGGVAGDTGSMSGGGIVSLIAGDTVELWADTNVADDRSITFKAASLSLIMLGGQ